MSLPFWVAELADLFWREAGMIEPFPRSLLRPIARALPLTVVLLPACRTSDVQAWLLHNGVACPCSEGDRPLRACLVARYGWGIAFIDGSDPEDERRFSLAHELAHFLRDYWHPRRLACERLGQRVCEVFDGLRPPTKEEELRAVLADIPVGFHIHLMGREADGGFSIAAVEVAEREADRLAFELLAPAEAVLAGRPDPSALERLLQRVYGLPPVQASDYADILLPPQDVDPLLRRLGCGG